jgi:ribosomal protein S18 acetylase RimI-like enzyme
MIIIRALEKDDDLHDLIAVSKDFFEEYEAHHEEFFGIDNLKEGDIVDFFTHSIEAENSATFVAVEEGRMVGYITVSVRPQPGFYKIKQVGAISGLMVHKDYRRRGIAGELLARAVAFFEEKNVRYYTVFTAMANQAAIRFYEKHGMAPLHTTMIGQIDAHQA